MFSRLLKRIGARQIRYFLGGAATTAGLAAGGIAASHFSPSIPAPRTLLWLEENQARQSPVYPFVLKNLRATYSLAHRGHVVTMNIIFHHEWEIYNELMRALGLEKIPEWSEMVSGKTYNQKIMKLLALLNAADEELVRQGHNHLVVVVTTFDDHPNLHKYFMPTSPHSFRYMQCLIPGLGQKIYTASRDQYLTDGAPSLTQLIDVVKDIRYPYLETEADLLRSHGSVAAHALRLLRQHNLVKPNSVEFTDPASNYAITLMR